MDKRGTLAILCATIFGLSADTSQADQSFTLAMEDGARKAWNKKLNDTLAEPFSKIACSTGDTMEFNLGKGCVEAETVDICCHTWTIDVACSDDNKWAQKSIEGSSCEQKKRPKK